jgi:glycosyltransferase involved in cell wall biosynthesis
VTPDLSVREHHELPERFFFYPAVAIPRKNHRCLIEAYGVAKSRGVELPHLVCSGGFVDDAYEAELRGLVAELGLGGHIRFIGHVSNAEMAGLYALCTAGVSSSFNEAGMAVIQEAGYLRRPVVCSNTPEAMTQAALYGWGLPMFDPNDPEDIARVLEGFIAEEPRHIAEAKHASEMIRAYSGEVIGQRYAELFHWICGKKDRPEWHPFA